jgi:hypothetical protein
LILSNFVTAALQEINGRRLKLITHLRLVSRLRIHDDDDDDVDNKKAKVKLDMFV